TYFLFMLGQAELGRTLFPIGDLTKTAVRAEATRLGLAVADKPESMEVCFVPDGDAAGFVARHAGPGRLRPGPIVDGAGREVGRHGGVHRFTIGQRRGLGLGGGPRRYVTGIDAAMATVTVGDGAALEGRGGLVAREVSWVAGDAPEIGTACDVRIRHRHPLI